MEKEQAVKYFNKLTLEILARVRQSRPITTEAFCRTRDAISAEIAGKHQVNVSKGRLQSDPLRTKDYGWLTWKIHAVLWMTLRELLCC